MTTIARRITGGVDTHLDVHVAAALDERGAQLGVESFAATAEGYRGLLGWLEGFGILELVGVEGTGSYGAGLTRHLLGQEIAVVEVDRPNRQRLRRTGKGPNPAQKFTQGRSRWGSGPAPPPITCTRQPPCGSCQVLMRSCIVQPLWLMNVTECNWYVGNDLVLSNSIVAGLAPGPPRKRTEEDQPGGPACLVPSFGSGRWIR